MSALSSILFFLSLIALIIGLIKPSAVLFKIKNPNKKKVLLLYGVLFILSLIIGNSNPQNNQQTMKSNNSKVIVTEKVITQIPTQIPTKEPTPTIKIVNKNQDPEVVFTEIAKKYSDSEPVILKEKDGWTITLIKEAKENLSLSLSKQIARDFIFELYATELPIKHASISINYYADGKFYQAGLGNDVASSQPKTTWTDKGVGPTIFYDFLKKYTNGVPGDGKFSTYVETNLN